MALEALSTIFGAFLVAFGVALAVATLRAMSRGKRAYHANKRLTSSNPIDVLKGKLDVTADFRERRSKSGMAVKLVEKRIIRQEMLSAEAIDEVIGRQI